MDPELILDFDIETFLLRNRLIIRKKEGESIELSICEGAIIVRKAPEGGVSFSMNLTNV